MPLTARTGVDNAGGGTLLAGPTVGVTIDGSRWALVGDPVASHGPSPHDAATLTQGSDFVTVEGLAPVLAGHLASCGDAATGSGHVTVSS